MTDLVDDLGRYTDFFHIIPDAISYEGEPGVKPNND